MTKEALLKNLFQWGVLAAIVAVAMPELAWAQGGTISEVVNDFQQQELTVFPNLLSAGAYIGGAVLGISGALRLKNHAENPTQEKMAPGLARLIAGGAIAAAPAILNTLTQSTHLGEQTAPFISWSPSF